MTYAQTHSHRKTEQEKRVVGTMTALYCRSHHGTKNGELCCVCLDLMDYSRARIDACPHKETKTFCSNCTTHCYKKDRREQIRIIMRFSGPRMLLRHPIVAIRHLITSRKEKKYAKANFSSQ